MGRGGGQEEGAGGAEEAWSTHWRGCKREVTGISGGDQKIFFG